MSTESNSAEYKEVDMFDVFAACVRAGEPIHVSGPLDESQARLHVALINRLTRETGRYVHVIYS